MKDLTLSPFSKVKSAVAQGKMVIMVDDADRENEGDLVVATECLSSEQLSFMAKEARGMVCVSISPERSQELNLPFQSPNNASAFETPFTMSVDLVGGKNPSTTIAGRTETICALADPRRMAGDFVTPGPIFPLIAHRHGVFGRQGQTEGSYDLARISGLYPSGVICEILAPDGTMLRGPALAEFADRFQLPVTSVREVIRYRLQHEIYVQRTAREFVDTDYGRALVSVYMDDAEQKEHLLLSFVKEELEKGSNAAPFVRIHSECLTGDVFGSERCDCRSQLETALSTVSRLGGHIAYLRQEGRGIGLLNKVRAYALQDDGRDTVEANEELGFPADMRDFAVAAQMLRDSGVEEIKLLTNNPEKVQAIETAGLKVLERVSLQVPATEYSASYLETKRQKLGHLLEPVG